MKSIINKLLLLLVTTLFVISCHKDLDLSPIDPDSFTEEDVFATADEAKSALAKLYGSLALTGQEGPSGQPDIDPDDIDEGFSQFSRILFNLNELTTDHAVVGWGDAGLQDLHGMYWGAGNEFIDGMYYRLGQTVSFSNSFIDNATALDDPEVQYYIAEARFLRAYAYYNLMDLYANVPLVTAVSTELPTQSNRDEIFTFVESELLEIQDLLKESQANEYGRVDKVAAWALLSKLYLNAEVWIGTPKYTECVNFSNEVMNSSYSINMSDGNGNGTAYDELFLADNNMNGAQNEFIFALNFDGMHSQTYGGTTFLIHAATGGCMDPTKLGVNGGWGGLRTTENLVNQFPETNDLASLNATLGAQSDWGLVGDATVNGWNGPDVEMYEIGVNEYGVFVELTTPDVDPPGEFKFRFNENWGINLGDGNDGNGVDPDGVLAPNEDNLKFCGDGIHYITLNLNDMSYTIEEVNDIYIDKRAMFFANGQSLAISDIGQFEEGYAVTKFKNVDVDGNQGSDSSGDFADTDLPLIRLAEIYLNYAEAVVRNGGGDLGTAATKINELRERAFGNTDGNITSGDIDLAFILDERSKELYWEGQRRTDLIRYEYFTTNTYLWPFKGNEASGMAVDPHRNIYPLPTNVLSVNPNLTQNEGY